MLDDGIFPDKDIAKFVTQENDKDAKNLSYICYTFNKHLILLTSKWCLFVFVIVYEKKQKNEFVKLKNVAKNQQLQFLQIEKKFDFSFNEIIVCQISVKRKKGEN